MSLPMLNLMEMFHSNRLNKNTINTKWIRSYSQFTLQDVGQRFGLKLVSVEKILDEFKLIPLSDFLKTALKKNVPLAMKIGTEKVRSELIIAPIVVELQEILQHTISFFSGIDFRANAKKGLTGRCDFIISKDKAQQTKKCK
jgi:hypothetical protein